MPTLPGAEPLFFDGGGVGVLLCHGFTSTPQSLRGWAESLAERGYTVSLPLLPGHGTRWTELAVTSWEDWYAAVERELSFLSGRCAQVYVCGLSMGATLALRLAAHHRQVAGLVLVNPAMTLPRTQRALLPLARHVVRTVPGLVGDIARAHTQELGYPRVPVAAAHSLHQLFRTVRRELPRVVQPLLVLHSRTDHVVPPEDTELVLNEVSSANVSEVVLEKSLHVATLDHDAERIFTETHAFIDRRTARKTASDRA